ncbi:MAG: cyclic nucleotide-binding domain-containing protein [Verrucomicrobiota bacterium]|nr:cyclic nucleotide-binding domain-containing protein [Verrucomicrobiota bacterium]
MEFDATTGDFFSELSFLDEGCRSITARVVEDAELLHMDRGDLDKFLHPRPAGAMDFLAAFGKGHRAIVTWRRHTATRNVNEEVEENRSMVQKTADWIVEFQRQHPIPTRRRS